MTPLYLDLETFSPIPITNGTYRYAEEAEIIMWQYAIGDGPVIVLDYDEVDIEQMRELLLDKQYEIVIQNSMFDRVVLKYVAGIDIPVSTIFDTAVCALAHSMPAGLEKLCELLGVDDDQSKDRRGKSLISLFCIPPPKKSNRGRATKHTHPKEWEEFREYGRRDITSLRAIHRKLPKWNYGPKERALWVVDQRINDRGIFIDMPLVDAALEALKLEKEVNDESTYKLTSGEVTSATRRDLLIGHILAEYGVPFEDLKATTVEKVLESSVDLPSDLRDLLSVRLQASKTSVTKYKRLKACVNSDRRLRGTSQFCGASRTGRSSGRLFQPLNLPRPTMKQKEIEEGISLLKTGAWAFIGPDKVTNLASSALRGTIIAPPGKKLAIADLSNIEGRTLAWLTFEEWKIQAFKDYDAELTGDPYITGYAKSFGVPVSEVTGDMRQIEKVKELAFQYGGGLGAWVTFASAYRIDLDQMASKIIGDIPSVVVTEAVQYIQWARKNKISLYGLPEETVIVCDSLKRIWRSSNSRITSYWKDLEEACRNALSYPGEAFRVRRHTIRLDGSWLRISIPGGNCLQYLHPKIIDGKLTYMGQNQFTRKWERLSTYGGKLAENATQKAARNILWDAMPEVEKAGYEITLHVYDEIVAEVPNSDEFSAGGLSTLMTAENEWNKGLPLAAKGFEAYRYQKG